MASVNTGSSRRVWSPTWLLGLAGVVGTAGELKTDDIRNSNENLRPSHLGSHDSPLCLCSVEVPEWQMWLTAGQQSAGSGVWLSAAWGAFTKLWQNQDLDLKGALLRWKFADQEKVFGDHPSEGSWVDRVYPVSPLNPCHSSGIILASIHCSLHFIAMYLFYFIFSRSFWLIFERFWLWFSDNEWIRLIAQLLDLVSHVWTETHVLLKMWVLWKVKDENPLPPQECPQANARELLMGLHGTCLARFACLWLCICLSLNSMCFWLPYFCCCCCCYTKKKAPKLLESFMIQNRTLVLLYIENGSLNFIMASNYFTFACVIYYYFIAV